MSVPRKSRTLKKSQFLKAVRQLHEGGAWQNLLGWDKQIAPFLIAVGFAPAGSRLAVLYTAFFLGDHIRIVQFILALNLDQVDDPLCFHNKIRLIDVATVVGDVELLGMGTKPIQNVIV